MSPESSPQSETLFFSASSGALSVLSHRIKSRLACRRLQFAPPKGGSLMTCVSEDEPDDDGDEERSESGSSSSSSSCNSTPHQSPAKAQKSIYRWNSPGVEFLDLPLEIIEHIAVLLREPRSSNIMDTAALYISDKYSDFSEARFHLSALSKVCSTLRNAVERILYQNIQLDFTGWKGRKHPKHPAGSLRLLLRTLEARPELGRYIHVAALDYQIGSVDCEPLEKGLEKFLIRTPRLTHLFLSQSPVILWGLPAQHLTGFATTFAPGILHSLLDSLPALQDLHLRDCHVMSLSGALPSHSLRRIRLDSSHENASGYFARLLSICGSTVSELDMRFIGGLQLRAPFFNIGGVKPALGGTALRTLRLNNISVLSHLSSGYAQLLRDLPSLETLHVSHHAPFAPAAFGMLPASLETLTMSAYYGLWTPESAKEGFMAALAACVSVSTRQVARIEASSGCEKGKEKIDARQDLQPVVAACKSVRLLFEKVESTIPFVTVFFGEKVAFADAEDAAASPSQGDDTDDEGEASFKDIIAAIPTRRRD